MNHLNPQQKKAVQEISVPCLVLAGAGSGKTKVIIEKIKFLLQQLPFSQKIAAVTFTNKASKEMQQRLQSDWSQGDVSEQKKIIKERTWIGTFHQLGIQILRHSGHFINLKSNFSILDQEDAISLLTEITLDKTLARQSLQHISHWKNKNLSPEEVAEHHDYQSKEWSSFIKVYDKYQKTLISYQAVDFDDLLRLPVTIFKNHQIALDYWGRQFAYFLVDEYQDTNPVQYLLLQYLTKNHQSFTVVGDDDQAIYGWRGASVEHLFQLIKDYHQLKTIKLEQNYRSTNAILYTANGVISCNPKPDESLHKQIWSALGQGTLPTVSSFPNSMIEAETVVRHLLQHQTHHRTKLGDYAILYRNNQQARVIEQQLRQHQIAYQISGGDSFFDKAEIRDVLAWLKLILNDDDDLAFIRAITHPKRGIGNSTLQYLSDYAQKNEQSLYASVFELGCAQYLQEKGLRKQYDVLHEFVLFISKMQHLSLIHI
jgi:ATP-dependent DNA helicase Rep